MAHVFCNKLKDAARYVGHYLRSYVDLSLAFLAGGLVAQYKLDEQPVAHVVRFLLNGAIENVGQVQNAWKNHADRLGRLPQRAVDLTISLDKPFSVAFVACASHRVALLELAKSAVVRVLAALEERCAVARAGPDAARVPGRWAYLAVPEFTNRRGEIQIHFHVIVFIAIECIDGVVRSMDTRPLFDHVKWAGALLTAELTHGLREMGLAAATRDGRLVIEGIPEALCDHWSSRRKEVVAFMSANNLTTAKQSHFAALASREEKHRDEPLSAVLTRHEAEARALGFDLRELEALCFERGHAVDIRRTPESLDIAAAEILMRAEPRSLRDVERQVAEVAPQFGIGIDGILAAARRATKRLGLSLDDLARRLEGRAIEKTLEALSERTGVSVTRAAIHEAVERHLLPPRFVDALESITRRGSAVRLLDGADASERNQVLAAFRDALARSGIDVVAVTLRRKDAESLTKATGIPTYTAARSCAEWRRAREPGLFQNANEVAFRKLHTNSIQDTLAWAFGLRTRKELDWRNCQRGRQPLDLADGPHVLIVEEAHILPSAVYSEILDEAHRTGATVVLSADTERAPELAALIDPEVIGSLGIAATTRPERELEAVLRLLEVNSQPDRSSNPWHWGIRR